MFTREGLCKALERYRELVARRGRFELFFWLVILVLASLTLLAYAEGLDPMAAGGYGFGLAGGALVAALVHRWVDRKCRQEAGLVCPKCRGVLTEQGALHIPLELVCENCGREVYAYATGS
jgi:hypothetical protein